MAILALLANAGLVGTSASAQEDVSGVDNRALLDAAATDEVLERAKTVSAELFTFDYTGLDEHKQTFADLTTGEFGRKYAELFGSIESQAAAQQVSLTSTVRDAAVRVLTEDEHAEVLVFLDQSSTRGDTGAQSTSGAMFLASLELVDDELKVSDLNLFEDQ